MARGFFSGVIAGTLVSGLGLGAASVLTGGAPGSQPPQAEALDVPAGSEFNQSLEDTEATLPEVADSPDAPDAPEVSAPEPDDLASLQGAVTEPAAQPEAANTEAVLSEPQAGAGAAGVEVDSENPVLPSPQTVAPAQPDSEQELSISTDPAQPAVPEIANDSVFPETSEEAQTEQEMAAMEPAEDEPASDTATAEQEPAAQEPDAAEEEPVEVAEPEPETTTTETAEPNTEEGTENSSSSTIGNLAPEVKTNRLPSVGDDTEEAATPEEDSTAETASDPDAGALPPLQRYAAEFENPEAKPLMSIILIDDGTSQIGLQALANFPYPLSFAVDASWDGAADAMATYRAAGFEVLTMINLPEGAGPQDTEVAMQATLADLPEAVAVMDGMGSGLQSSRAAAEQLAPILLESGHGAVFFPKGLNTAQQLLAREGVPAVSVFRDFDAKGQNATVIRRFLDQAAFKAGQEDAGVVMVGRLRPDTVSALLLWGLQDRASKVALAPISAILRGE